MTGDIKVGFLENFAINRWYRFVAYIGAIILILSLFLEPKEIQIENVRGFAIWSILIGLSLWIINDFIDEHYKRKYRKDKEFRVIAGEMNKGDLEIKIVVNVGGFICWVILILIYFFLLS